MNIYYHRYKYYSFISKHGLRCLCWNPTQLQIIYSDRYTCSPTAVQHTTVQYSYLIDHPASECMRVILDCTAFVVTFFSLLLNKARDSADFTSKMFGFLLEEQTSKCARAPSQFPASWSQVEGVLPLSKHSPIKFCRRLYGKT